MNTSNINDKYFRAQDDDIILVRDNYYHYVYIKEMNYFIIYDQSKYLEDMLTPLSEIEQLLYVGLELRDEV